MVRLSDLPPDEAQHMREQECEPFATSPFVSGPPLTERRVALITTAGLHLRDQPAWQLGDAGYRVFPGDIDANQLVMGHVSVNFDRTGFQQDVNVVFPIERLRAMQASGEVGSVANFHYSLMGATATPQALEPTAAELAGMLHADAVNAVVLLPV
ncbi:MAG: glycine/sarcosine/betaine reductase selenoprotein B family protein [Burkholderiaceae bacterium]